jgi:hypothetical protein
MRFRVNDIVASAPGFSRDVFVISSIEPHRPKNQYNGTSIKSGKKYRLGDDNLAQKRIGTADPDWDKVTLAPSLNSLMPNMPVSADWMCDGEGDGDGGSNQNMTVDQTFLRGQARAQREVSTLSVVLQFNTNVTPETEFDKKRWEKLANLKPGDKFQCRVRGVLDTMTFRYVTERGYKFVFVAENGNGTRYKYPLNVVVV